MQITLRERSIDAVENYFAPMFQAYLCFDFAQAIILLLIQLTVRGDTSSAGAHHPPTIAAATAQTWS